MHFEDPGILMCLSLEQVSMTLSLYSPLAALYSSTQQWQSCVHVDAYRQMHVASMAHIHAQQHISSQGFGLGVALLLANGKKLKPACAR